MKHKQLLAVLAAAALAIAPLSGCTKPQQNSSVAMGRYIEQAWTLPGAEGDTQTSLHRSQDGKIAMLAGSYEKAEWRYYTTEDGGSWQQESPAWLEALSGRASYISVVDFNSKGEGIVVYYGLGPGGEEENYRIGLIRPDGSYQDSDIGGDDPWEAERFTSVIKAPTQDDPLTEEPLENENTSKTQDDPPTQESGEEPPADEADMPEEDAGLSSLFIEDALIGEDGLVYIQSFYDYGCFDPATGQLLATYLRHASAYTVAGDQMVQLLVPDSAALSGQNISEYSLFFQNNKNSEVERILPAESLRLGTGVTLTAQADGTLFLTDSSGLYRIASGGETWEKLLNGALCSLSTPSLFAHKLIPHGENEFLVGYGGDGYKLLNYVYSPDTPTLPDSELTVYSMLGNQTLSQAVGVFRQQYPNTLVNIRTSNDDDSSGNGDDARKALNTELLAGKGPDLFLLADLPLESYLEKGVLADISDVIQPMIDSGELLPAPAVTYRQGDGIYAVPTRITVPTLWGDREALAAAHSLDGLIAYAEKHPDIRLFGDMTPRHLLYRLAPSQWDNLVDHEGGVNVDGVEQLLAGVMRLSGSVNKPHLYEYFGSEEFSDEMLEEWNTSYHPWPDDFYGVANGRTVLMPTRLDGFISIGLPNGVMYKRMGGITTYDEEGEGRWDTSLPDDMVHNVFRTFPEGGYFMPTSVVGINAASTQQELARAFVKAMLSVETQTADFSDGFPINRTAIASNVERQESWYASQYYKAEEEFEPEELVIEYAWSSKAMQQAVADMLETLERPIGQNYSLGMQYAMEELLQDALDQVITGKSTPRGAAEGIANQLRIAFAE